MLWNDTLRSAVRGVTVNGTRAFLTTLGIIIGVGAVVLMSSIGRSVSGLILGQISALGSSSMVIFPGKTEGAQAQLQAGFDSLTLDDVEALKRLSSIGSIAPIITMPGRTSYGREEASPPVMGVTPEYFHNGSIVAREGRIIDASDIAGAGNVAVIGPDTRDELFGQADPLGKRIKVGNNHFTVIGVTAPQGSQFFQNADDRVLVPFSVAREMTGQRYINMLTMEATGEFDRAFDDVRWLLRQRHGIDNPENDEKKDDFIVHSSEQANQILGSVSLGLVLFITIIATISLLVGGIGIMNIMLVSVTERTQEIGLRMAVGATRRDILRQFLLESVVFTVLGGIAGILLGILLAAVAALIAERYLSSYAFSVSLIAVAAAFAMALITGIVFGIAPARRAASLNPIEALRYE